MELNLKEDFDLYDKDLLVYNVFKERNFMHLNNYCQTLGLKLVEHCSQLKSGLFNLSLSLSDPNSKLSSKYIVYGKGQNKKNARLESYSLLTYELIKNKDIYLNEKFINRILKDNEELSCKVGNQKSNNTNSNIQSTMNKNAECKVVSSIPNILSKQNSEFNSPKSNNSQREVINKENIADLINKKEKRKKNKKKQNTNSTNDANNTKNDDLSNTNENEEPNIIITLDNNDKKETVNLKDCGDTEKSNSNNNYSLASDKQTMKFYRKSLLKNPASIDELIHMMNVFIDLLISGNFKDYNLVSWIFEYLIYIEEEKYIKFLLLCLKYLNNSDSEANIKTTNISCNSNQIVKDEFSNSKFNINSYSKQHSIIKEDQVEVSYNNNKEENESKNNNNQDSEYFNINQITSPVTSLLDDKISINSIDKTKNTSNVSNENVKMECLNNFININSESIKLIKKFNIKIDNLDILEKKLIEASSISGFSTFSLDIVIFEKFLKSLLICKNNNFSIKIAELIYGNINLDEKAFLSISDRDYFYHKIFLMFLEEKDKVVNKKDEAYGYCLLGKIQFIGLRYSKYVLSFDSVNNVSFNYSNSCFSNDNCNIVNNTSNVIDNNLFFSSGVTQQSLTKNSILNKNKNNGANTSAFQRQSPPTANDIVSFKIIDKSNSDISFSTYAQVHDVNNNKNSLKLIVYIPKSIVNSISLVLDKIEVEVSFIMNTFIFDKLFLGVKKFCSNSTCCSEDIKNIILSTTKEEISVVYNRYYANNDIMKFTNEVNHFKANNRNTFYNKINEFQSIAITKALTNPLTLVIGPPGTGKTLTAIEIVKYWQNFFPGKRILLACDSNIAIDNIFKELVKNKVACVRIGNINKQLGGNSTRNNTNPNNNNNKGMMITLTIGAETKQYSYTEAKNKLSSFKIVCCTLFGALTELFNDLIFEKVLIDESSQTTELNSLFPISYRCNQLVLIGDNKQLPACVFSKTAISKGFSISLFERLIGLGIDYVFLSEQYRMHPSISEFSSQIFYENRIINGQNTLLYEPIPGFKWQNPYIRWAFIDSSKMGSFEEVSGSSIINKKEAEIVLSILSNEYMENYPLSSIGVITPYDAQKKLIINKIQLAFGILACDVDTVDGYQGMEKDLIIISFVRANNSNSLGFLTDYRRLNVSLTRAKRGMIVIGNGDTLRKDKYYYNLINYSKQVGAYMS